MRWRKASERKTPCARAAGKSKGTASGDGFMYVLMSICGDANALAMSLESFRGRQRASAWRGVGAHEALDFDGVDGFVEDVRGGRRAWRPW